VVLDGAFVPLRTPLLRRDAVAQEPVQVDLVKDVCVCMSHESRRARAHGGLRLESRDQMAEQEARPLFSDLTLNKPKCVLTIPRERHPESAIDQEVELGAIQSLAGDSRWTGGRARLQCNQPSLVFVKT
jgi:hypothetical protein